MKVYSYQTTTHVPANQLYAAISDINRWGEWGGDLEWTRHEGLVEPGSRFTLKPLRGPEVRMEIVEADPGRAFSDLAHLPLAKMRTGHVFEQRDGLTNVTITIAVWGLLGFVWDRIVARNQAADFAEHTRHFIAFAEARP